MKLLLLFLAILPLRMSRTCWGYSELEYEGRIDKSDKIQITCEGDYCLTLYEEGSDFNVYNGTCPDSSVTITDCETRGAGCSKEKLRDVYVKVCCCNYDLCNLSASSSFSLLCFIVLVFGML